MATSVVSSVIDLYNSISATHFGGTRPTIFLGEAAQVTSAGAQQRPPFVVLYDEGMQPTYDSSNGGIEAGVLRLEVYALKVNDTTGVTVDTIVAGIRWGGSAPGIKAGFDWGTFTLTGYLSKISLKLTKHSTTYAGFNHEGQRVHKCELVYRVVAGLSAT